MWGWQVAQPVCVCLLASATDMSLFKLQELFNAQSRDSQNQCCEHLAQCIEQDALYTEASSEEEQASEFSVK